MAGDTMIGPCVEFAGTKNADGYGVLPKAVNGSRLAHRAALARSLGRAVVGVARHRCDNPPCVNPDHLMEGTQAENMRDAMERGRSRGGRADQTHCIRGHELTEGERRVQGQADGQRHLPRARVQAVQALRQHPTGSAPEGPASTEE